MPTSASPFPVTIDADRFATLTLEPNHGPMVILDRPLIERLEVTIRSLLAGPPAGLILASGSPRVFIAGADLKSIAAMDHAALENYLRYGQEVFGLLCHLPCPTVAAINGAALGGGLELAMHCDTLVAAPAPLKDGQPKPYPIGLPEAGLCICPGWGGTNLLPARIDPADALQRTATGKTMTIDQAATAGLVTLAPSAENLLDAARSALRSAGNSHAARRDGLPLHWLGRPATRNSVHAAWANHQDALSLTDHGAVVMKAVAAGLEQGWSQALDVERTELNRLRAAPAGRDAIGAFLKK